MNSHQVGITGLFVLILLLRGAQNNYVQFAFQKVIGAVS